MAKTLGQVLSYVHEVLPNSFPTTTLITFVNDEIRLFWQYLTSTEYYEFQMSSGQAIYSFPTNVKMDQVIENGVLISDTTSSPTSSAEWTAYTFCGADEELTGSRYFEALDNFGVYPVPDNGYYARLIYQDYPTLMASSDTNTQFDLDQDYVDILTYRTLARVAKSGKYPRVDLANNYTLDAKEIEQKMKVKQMNDFTKTARKRWSYKQWY